MGDLLLIIVILCVTYATGSIIEKNHFKKIRQREIALVKKPVVTFGKKLTTSKKIKNVELVTGEAAISGDYFKTFVSAFRNFFGGRMVSFESIMDRARLVKAFLSLRVTELSCKSSRDTLSGKELVSTKPLTKRK